MSLQTGLFIGKASVDEIQTIFNKRSKGLLDPALQLSAKKHLLEGSWKDYSQIFIALYVMSLSTEKTWCSSDVSEDDVIFQTLVDIDLIDRTDQYGALNEFAVHDLIRLRARLLEILPAGSRLSRLGVGCALLGFSVPIADAYKGVAHGSEDFKQDMKQQLIDNGWARLQKLFHIADYHM